MNNVKRIRKKSIGILIILCFLIPFLTPIDFTKLVNFSWLGTRNVNASGSNYLFKDKVYNLTLSDVYDDEDLDKIYTDAYFQSVCLSDDPDILYNESVDSGVNNTNVKSPSNTSVTMINGTFDNSDNMKVNDDVYSEFETDSYVGVPNEYIDSITYTKGTSGSGNLGNTQTDDSNYKQVDSTTTTLKELEIAFNIDPVYAGRDFYFSYHSYTNNEYGGDLKVNGVAIGETRQTHDFDDLLIDDVTSITFRCSMILNPTYYLRIYYFKLVEDKSPTPAVLNFTVDLNFNELDTSKLLALDISSHHYTNISQIIIGEIYDYNGGTYANMFSSSNTVETENTFSDESSVDHYLSGSGNLKLRYRGPNNTSNFKLFIDFISVRFCYKMDLWHEVSFNMTGSWRYRWELHGSLQYTDWTYFEVIDPDPNFYAISESDYMTRWILQGAEISAIENFTDDISGSNWNLCDVSEDSFYASSSSSYLLDNTTSSNEWDYTGVHFDTGAQDYISEDITWDGTYFWMVGIDTDEVYKYTAAGDYTDVHFDTGAQDNSALGITWDGTNFWVVGKINKEVFKYTSAGVYTGTHFDVGTEESGPQGIIWDGTYFWVVGLGTDEIYKYTSAGVYTGVHFYIGTEDISPSGITWDGTYLWMMGYMTSDAYQYENLLDVSKKYQGGGLMYMQTNTTELISLKSTDYSSHYTLSSGDYFEVDFQTSSNSLINLILLKDGVVNKTLTLSPSENSNFNRHTVKLSVDETVEFDQLKINSTFEDMDYVKVYDIKTMKYTITGDYADFYVGSKRDYNIYLTPDVYNLRISENNIEVINENVTIPTTGVRQYVYQPMGYILCRLTLFSLAEEYLQFEDYHVNVSRSLGGEYGDFWLVDALFYADIGTYVYIEVYDRFDALIYDDSELVKSYIDLYIEVYSLKIRNEATDIVDYTLQNTDTGSSKSGILFSDEIVEYHVKSGSYSLDYTNYEDMFPREYNFELTDHRTISINSTYHTIYFSLFTYDGLGINHDLVRFYINDERKEFGFNVIDSETANLVVLDFFNNTLANDTIDASAYSEYNIYVEIYSMIILNQFTYEDIVVNITQVGSGIWITQIIPKQFGLNYRFLPNVEYNITIYFTNMTFYESRIVNLTDNSHIESFGVPTQPSEYPKNVYFGVYTTTGLGINHDLVRFYIDDVRTDFGFNRIEDMIILLTVKDYFNTTLFNQYVNTSGIYEYNILITLFSLKIKNEARETSNYTLKLGGLETTGLIIPQEIIEYQLAQNNYVFEFTNNEDDSSDTININLNQDRFYILNSTYYNIYFSLYDINLHTFYPTQYEFRLNNTVQDLGLIEDLQTDNYNITIKDRFGTYLFNNIINLRGLNEYRIGIILYELQIRHLAQENSNLTLIEDILGNNYSFIMAPDTIKSIVIGSADYILNWTNGENNQLTSFSINLNQDRVYILNSTYYNIYFSLYDVNLHTFNPYKYEFRLNNTIQDLGLIEDLQTDDYIITVKDRFGTYLFNNIVNLRGLNEYRIDISLYELQIRHLATENSNLTLIEDVFGNNYSFIMTPDSIKLIIIGSSNYTLNWINGEDSQLSTFSINLNQDRVIKLDTIHYGVYFSLYDQNNHRLDDSLFSLYLNSSRKDFGFVGLHTETYNIKVYDWLNVSVFAQTVYLVNYNEYNIFITVFELQIRHLAYENSNITLYETTTHNCINFSMAPDTIRSFTLSNSTYNITWTNGENMLSSFYNITLDLNYILTLDTTYFDVYFGLFTYDGMGIDHDFLRFYINGVRKDFGFNLLTQNTNTLTVLDYFGKTLYSTSMNLRPYSEWNIYVTIYTLNLFNNYTFPIDVKIERNNMEVRCAIPPQSFFQYRFVPFVDYEITWYYENGTKIDSMELEFEENGMIVSFGFFEIEVPSEPEPISPILIAFICIAIVFTFIFAALYARWKVKAKEVPEDVRLRYKNKRKGTPAGTYDHRL